MKGYPGASLSVFESTTPKVSLWSWEFSSSLEKLLMLDSILGFILSFNSLSYYEQMQLSKIASYIKNYNKVRQVIY